MSAGGGGDDVARAPVQRPGKVGPVGAATLCAILTGRLASCPRACLRCRLVAFSPGGLAGRREGRWGAEGERWAHGEKWGTAHGELNTAQHHSPTAAIRCARRTGRRGDSDVERAE